MKASIEKIEPGFGSSFSIKKFSRQYLRKRPVWHMHPEFEIVYISDGEGKRHIGNHISFFKDGDLIFLGPNLPHFGFTQDQQEDHYEIVAQMREDFLGPDFMERTEMRDIKRLLERARTGLSFHGKTKMDVGRKLLKIYKAQPFQRLIGFLEVLQLMALSDEVESLQVNGLSHNVQIEDESRVQNVYALVQGNFQRNIPLEEVADVANMTVPAFCRFFKKATDKTFTQFVNEIRITNATKLLSETDMLITEVAHESGFNNLSHFNKSFLKVTGQRPTDYRRQASKVVSVGIGETEESVV